VVVICLHRGLQFGALTLLARVLSLLLEPESQVRRMSDALHEQLVADPVAAEVRWSRPAFKGLLVDFAEVPLIHPPARSAPPGH